MFSAAHCCADGREAWTVWHDSARDRYDLSTHGALSAEFEPIKKRLTAAQDADVGAQSLVDYIYDIPVELAAELTGYRHDQWKFEWGQPHFTTLERDH